MNRKIKLQFEHLETSFKHSRNKIVALLKANSLVDSNALAGSGTASVDPSVALKEILAEMDSAMAYDKMEINLAVHDAIDSVLYEESTLIDKNIPSDEAVYAADDKSYTFLTIT